ncbi:hypothetical protein L202_07257 [Cryptococcus amylolentus CBS 6039]|uniref:Uncharacterized protein n=1 Tax=Cryptococcus amylolentus CBS 6039 TaxID=1295533 RepID=A0A1E3HBK9_9TREE|nr:hypothetical protein L202_07257 [Cryptococcus amylolentus CBS 6039]ODN73717.1 hypothetical protein L202_07257 [Cryptococcus amylolentus CBS 6039]
MTEDSLPSSSQTLTSPPTRPPPLHRRLLSSLSSELDAPGSTNLISIYACFLTGFTSAPSFSACFIWCGFQTGNVAQLGLALARCFAPGEERTYGFQKPDQQALVSLLAFWIGTSLGRVGDWTGARRRRWLGLATFVQALLAMAAALTIHFSGESGLAGNRGSPSWRTPLGMTALAFLSATMGIQGIVGKRIASPMNTTVVLTTTWVEIFNDPFLFSFKYTPSRDIRIMGGLAVFLGAFVSRAILDASSSAGVVGVLAGLRMVQLGWWFLIPDKEVKKVETVNKA